MSEPIATLDRAGYRTFGLVTGAILAGLFGLLIPFLLSLDFPRWPWVGAAVLSLWALLAPGSLRPVYVLWMKFGNVMNWINTRLILGIVFYGMFVPFGLVMRLLGKDPMRRKLEPGAISYRIDSAADTRENVEHPY